MAFEYIQDGESGYFFADFLFRGEFRVADPGSVTYTLYGADGSAVAGQIDVDVSTGETSQGVAFTIDGAYNTLTGDNILEGRRVRLNMTVGGRPEKIDFLYRVITPTNFYPNPSSVRNLLGISEEELPDEDIDCYATFVKMYDLLADALETSGSQAIAAQNAIYVRTAMDIIPSLQLRANQKESDGNFDLTRFAKIDWAALTGALSERLAEEMGIVDPTLADYDFSYGAYSAAQALFEEA